MEKTASQAGRAMLEKVQKWGKKTGAVISIPGLVTPFGGKKLLAETATSTWKEAQR